MEHQDFPCTEGLRLTIENITSQLNKVFTNAVKKIAAPGILFSGGLDTSIIAAIACRIYAPSEVQAVTINLLSEGEDLQYSKELAQTLRFHHIQRSISIDEAIEAIPIVIKALGSFDPAIPNDITAYYGLKTLSGMGITSFMTGDGADELFGGYDFMKEIDDLPGYIRRIASHMSFSSNMLADFLAMDVRQPFLDKNVIKFALEIPNELRIREEHGIIHGKWVLRKAFEDLLPSKFIWQGKRPLEYGSGMTRLRGIISSMISDEEFQNNPYPIRFFNKEHFYYFKVFCEVVGTIPGPEEGEKSCPGCGAGMPVDSFHCHVCGHVLELLNGS
ncbi:MAG: asparagine synthase-related protein [Proteobacteria bacterium]|nr:asparagine synthase-related protein [Pseudomonadota bacterium]